MGPNFKSSGNMDSHNQRVRDTSENGHQTNPHIGSGHEARPLASRAESLPGSKQPDQRSKLQQPVPRLESYLSDTDDRLQYYINHGGNDGKSRSGVNSNLRKSLIANNADVKALASSTISPRKSDPSISNVAAYDDDEKDSVPDPPSISSIVERASNIKKRLETEGQAENTNNLLREAADDFYNVLLDYSRFIPTKCSPSSYTSGRRRSGDVSRHQRASLLGSHRAKHGGKQAIRDQLQKQGSEPAVDVTKVPSGHTICVLRCFYFFGDDPQGRRCDRTKLGIRDLIVHWKHHSVYYCPVCSQYFNGPSARERYNGHKASHEENRMCVDIGCANLADLDGSHPRRNGCVDLRYVENKRRKYYSLFNIALPNTAWPPWDEVKVEFDSTTSQMTLSAGGVHSDTTSQLDEPMELDSVAHPQQPFLFDRNEDTVPPSPWADDMAQQGPSGSPQLNNAADMAAMQQEIAELRIQQQNQQREHRDQQTASETQINDLQNTVNEQGAMIQALRQTLERFINIANGTVNPRDLQKPQ